MNTKKVINSNEIWQKMGARWDADPTNLKYWYPKIKNVVPTPKTVLIEAPNLFVLLDQEMPDGWQEFCKKIHEASLAVNGYPAFLRTSHTSAKHNWKNTCYLPNEKSIPSHIVRIVEFCEIADMMGTLGYKTWAVREMLSSPPAFTAFENMPITREIRFFVDDGKVIHQQPYWPPGAIRQPSCNDWKDKLISLNNIPDNLLRDAQEIALRINEVVPGYWSVDLLWVKGRGWVVIDMAEGNKSYKYDPKTGK